MAYLKCEVYIPDEDKWTLIDALNNEGFLYDEGYDKVFAESPVIGHFTPLEGSNPDIGNIGEHTTVNDCLLYTFPSPRDATLSRMPSSA